MSIKALIPYSYFQQMFIRPFRQVRNVEYCIDWKTPKLVLADVGFHGRAGTDEVAITVDIVHPTN